MKIPVAIVGHVESESELQAACDASTIMSLAQLKNRKLPSIYDAGIYYRNEQRKTHFPEVERFQTASSLHNIGAGDCDDLACVRAAELILEGENARAIPVRSPGIGWHVVVLRENGRVEDPSARLGMLNKQQKSTSRTRADKEVFMDGEEMPIVMTKKIGGKICVGAIMRIGDYIVSETESEEEPIYERPHRKRARRLRLGLNVLKNAGKQTARYAVRSAVQSSPGTQRAIRATQNINRMRGDLQTLNDLGVSENATDEQVGALSPAMNAYRMLMR